MEEKIKEVVQAVLQELELPECDFVVEHPADFSHGDYACNVAMVAAKEAGKNPRELAETIVLKLEGKISEVEKIEIAGPGFINLALASEFFKETLTEVLEAKDNWGRSDIWKGKTVLVEYTDPNPFKEFHIGHLFTNTVGESLARLFVMSGADTKRVNYQGDVGLHVACALWGLRELGFAGARDMSSAELGKAYALGAMANKENKEAAAEIKTINKAVYDRSDESLNELYDKGRSVSLEYFEDIYKTIGTSFDYYFFESESGPRGRELVLAHEDVFPESDGARIFKGEEHGLHTRVFVNSEGLPTYEAKEIALAKMKADEVSYNLSIVSTSNEVNEYFKVLKKAMSFIYPELAEKTEHIGHGTVRLQDGKMSSRTGQVIPALQFIHEIKDAVLRKIEESGNEADDALAQQIAIGAIKYATLKSNILQDTVFSTEQALSFEGDSGPYLMYTHARICSVMKKAEGVGVVASTEHVPHAPYGPEKLLYQFPEVVEKALTERAPHIIAGYLTELAGAFNTFYAQEKIADETDEYAPYKLALSGAVAQTLKNGLWVLGIGAPEQM
ncbi:arginine--tRNA ligase [bacterium]|nr:arginine--tRNA ligase [bacterium]